MYGNGNPISNVDPTGHFSMPGWVNEYFNNTFARIGLDLVCIIGGVVTEDPLLVLAGAADMGSVGFKELHDKQASLYIGLVADVANVAMLAKAGYSLLRMGKTIQSMEKVTDIYVDVDKTLLQNSAKLGKSGEYAEAFKDSETQTMGENWHSKYPAGREFKYNESLARSLGQQFNAGKNIRILSTGGWRMNAYNAFQDYIRGLDNGEYATFHFESAVSTKESAVFNETAGALEKDNSAGYRWYEKKLQASAKRGYLTRNTKRGTFMLLDDEPYHTYGARLAGGAGFKAYKTAHMQILNALFAN